MIIKYNYLYSRSHYKIVHTSFSLQLVYVWLAPLYTTGHNPPSHPSHPSLLHLWPLHSIFLASFSRSFVTRSVCMKGGRPRYKGRRIKENGWFILLNDIVYAGVFVYDSQWPKGEWVSEWVPDDNTTSILSKSKPFYKQRSRTQLYFALTFKQWWFPCDLLNWVALVQEYKASAVVRGLIWSKVTPLSSAVLPPGNINRLV